jgi:hypothetical protein
MDNIDYRYKAQKYKHKYLMLQQIHNGGNPTLTELIFGKSRKKIEEENKKKKEEIIKRIKDTTRQSEINFNTVFNDTGFSRPVNEISYLLIKDILNEDPLYKSNKDIILAAVQENGDVYKYDHNFKDDIDVIRAALSNRGNSIYFMNLKYKENEELIKLAITSNNNSDNVITFLPEKFTNDKNIIILFITKYPMGFNKIMNKEFI